ncbi:pyruvate kinase, partial [bacterium]|nr:pyruvate kinase [bacterium]
MSRTRVVCTIGPATSSPDAIRALADAGMNVARLNFSHGTHDEHAAAAAAVRQAAEAVGRPIAVLQDLAGPKVRVGLVAGGGVELASGQPFVLTTRSVSGGAEAVSVSYEGLPGDVEQGDVLMLADGAIELTVESVSRDDIVCRVVAGGRLSSHKGINLPATSITVPVLTEKDRIDLAFGAKIGVDAVAVSFVRSADDITVVRNELGRMGSDVPIIAKIEKHEAVENLNEIIAVVEGVMVARGDLGVEIPLEHVPLVQKRIIAEANRAAKPVITATQML